MTTYTNPRYKFLIAFVMTLAFAAVASASQFTFDQYGNGAFDISTKGIAGDPPATFKGTGAANFFDFKMGDILQPGKVYNPANGWTEHATITNRGLGDFTVKTWNGSTVIKANQHYALGNSVAFSSPSEFTTAQIKLGKYVTPYNYFARFTLVDGRDWQFGGEGTATLFFTGTKLNRLEMRENVFTTTNAARMALTETTPTPEPVTMILLGTGLAGTMAEVRRRRRSAKIETEETV